MVGGLGARGDHVGSEYHDHDGGEGDDPAEAEEEEDDVGSGADLHDLVSSLVG